MKDLEQVTQLVLDKLSEHCSLKYSEKIQKVWDKTPITVEYLREVQGLPDKKDRVTILIFARSMDYVKYGKPHEDVVEGFIRCDKPQNSTVPYVLYSFSKEYKLPLSEEYRNCIMLFFSNHATCEETEEHVSTLFNRFSKLKSFI